MHEFWMRILTAKGTKDGAEDFNDLRFTTFGRR